MRCAPTPDKSNHGGRGSSPVLAAASRGPPPPSLSLAELWAALDVFRKLVPVRCGGGRWAECCKYTVADRVNRVRDPLCYHTGSNHRIVDRLLGSFRDRLLRGGRGRRLPAEVPRFAGEVCGFHVAIVGIHVNCLLPDDPISAGSCRSRKRLPQSGSRPALYQGWCATSRLPVVASCPYVPRPLTSHAEE